MPLPTIAPRILPEEYDAFLVILKVDDDFPATYEDWLERRTQEDAKSKARGAVINEVVVHPQEFTDYCRACGQKPSLYMLGATAVNKVNRNP